MDCEVIVSTYNKPRELNLVLLALARQRGAEFGVCVADDGSAEPTAELVARWTSRLGPQRLRRVWHPDDGFQKNRILNRAIATSAADYLIFIDGDCLARPDFVATHLRRRRPRGFLSGGMVRLNRQASAALDEAAVEDGRVFGAQWLRRQLGTLSLSTRLKAGLLAPPLAALLERVTPVKRTWNGANSSGWRRDIVAVNGFDERLRYGAEDVEMGVRMAHDGVRAISVRYSLALLHIDHDRPYADAAVIARNQAHVAEVRRSGRRWTEFGIRPGAATEPEAP